MNVIAINGSARKDGNTAIMLKNLLGKLEKEGIGTELVQLAGKNVHGCLACFKCIENKDSQCSYTKDIVNELIEKMIGADGIVIGSPVYFADITSETKALIDRAGMVARANGHLFRRKVGAAVVAKRRGGAMHALDSINHLLQISQMIIPGSIYWNVGIGRQRGEVESDEEGMLTRNVLAENMAWLLKAIDKQG